MENVFSPTVSSNVLRHSVYKIDDEFNKKLFDLSSALEFSPVVSRSTAYGPFPSGKVCKLGVVNNNGISTVAYPESKNALDFLELLNSAEGKCFSKRGFRWDSIFIEQGRGYL